MMRKLKEDQKEKEMRKGEREDQKPIGCGRRPIILHNNVCIFSHVVRN
jgi:hypothetical protein